MKLIATLTVPVVLSLIACKKVQADYGRINRFLESKVSNDEVGPNMEAALDLLEKVDGKPESLVPFIPIAELKKFTSLKQVLEDNKCDGSVDQILSANENTVQARRIYYSDRRDYRSPTRRIDSVILKVAQDYAKRCEKFRLQEYLARRNNMDTKLSEQVDDITRFIMEKNRIDKMGDESYYEVENLFHVYVIRYSIFLLTDRNILRRALINGAKGDPDVKYLQRDQGKLPTSGSTAELVNKIKGLTMRYLVEPCQRFVDELGPGLFVPARHAVRVFETDSSKRYKSFMNGAEYYLGWSQFMICQVIANSRSIVIHDIIKSL